MDQLAEQLIARLRENPNDAAAHGQLKDLYRQAGDLRRLANLMEGYASNTSDAMQASGAYLDAAETVVLMGDDPTRAKTLYRQAIHYDVNNEAAAAQLQKMLEDAGEWHELAEFLDEYARTLEQAGGAARPLGIMYKRLGELWSNRFDHPETAQAYFDHAYFLDPSLKPEGSRTVAPPNDEAQAMAAHLEMSAEVEGDPARRIQLFTELGQLRAEQLGDIEGAVQALRRALEGAPGDIQVMHQLADYLLRRAALLDEQEAAADYRRVAELFYQIAQGVDPELALTYLHSAMEAVPDHDAALALLEETATALDRPQMLPAYWVAYLAAAAESPEADQRRLYLGQAYIDGGQLEDAIFCLQPAAEHGNEHANQMLQEIYAREEHLKPPPTQEPPEAIVAEPSDEPPAPQADARRADLPTTRPPPRRTDEPPSKDAPRSAKLHRALEDQLAAHRQEEAAETCKQILALDATDPEAFSVLENHYRRKRDHAELCQLLLSSTRAPGLPVDARKMRLREVATLSESKLKDIVGAVSAWRGTVTLDPSDSDASANLKRLLKQTEQWDELAGVLERETLSATAAEDKAALLAELASIHRDNRSDLPEAADALRQLHALRPDDVEVRERLCEVLTSIERYEELPPLLEARIEAASTDKERLRLLNELAAINDERLANPEAAYDACQRILEIKDADRSAIERMERIDERSGQHGRLLETLKRRANHAPREQKAALLIRMGNIAHEHLSDLDRAAEYFGDALDLVPDDAEALHSLSEMFERAERFDDLVELLRERTVLDAEPVNRVELYRRMAQLLAYQLEDEAGASDAYQSLIEIKDDEEALRYLETRARRDGEHATLAGLLRRLSQVVEQLEDKRTLLYDVAMLYRDELSQPADAVDALRQLVNEVDPRFEPAILELEALCEAQGDHAGLANALERRIDLTEVAADRIPVARKLANLYETELDDQTGAIRTLQRWVSDNERDPEPHRRIRKLLTEREDHKALLVTLDALSAWEDEFESRDSATIAAAKLTVEHFDDVDGAWNRLLPLVREGSEEADAALAEICETHDRQAHLAALYVQLAQEAEEPAAQGLHWQRAARLYSSSLGQPTQAFEAALRMLATDMSNRDFLTDVDRMGVEVQAWPRLAQVYDRLLKESEDGQEKVGLLVRHAELLHDTEASDALDRILRACALAPTDDGLLRRAEELAQRAKRGEDLLVVYDRHCANSGDAETRVDLMLRAARLCDGVVRERDRANAFLKKALGFTEDAPQLAESIEKLAQQLDDDNPEHGHDNAQRALLKAHRELAERAGDPFAARLLLRAAEVLRTRLDDNKAAFDVLRQALSQLPGDDVVFETTAELAQSMDRLDALDAHLSRLVDDAMDSESATALLVRRAGLLEGPLNRFQDAAEVYQKLLVLQPNEQRFADKLRASLRRSGRYQDLLLALNKELQRTDDPSQRAALLREVAITWDANIRNRYEAIDAWKAVLGESEGDEQATEAIARLEAGTFADVPEPAVTGEHVVLTDGDDVVAFKGDEGTEQGPLDQERPGDGEQGPTDEEEPADEEEATDAQEPSDAREPTDGEEPTDAKEPTGAKEPTDEGELAAEDERDLEGARGDAPGEERAELTHAAQDDPWADEAASGADPWAESEPPAEAPQPQDEADGEDDEDDDLPTARPPAPEAEARQPEPESEPRPPESGAASDEGSTEAQTQEAEAEDFSAGSLEALDASLEASGHAFDDDVDFVDEYVEPEILESIPHTPPPAAPPRLGSVPPPVPGQRRAASIPPALPGASQPPRAASIPPPVPGASQPPRVSSVPPPVPGASPPRGAPPPLPGKRPPEDE